MNKKFWMALLAAGALLTTPACSDDKTPEENEPNEPETQTEIVVYATGSDGTQGVYWCNGEAVTLKSPISETPKWTRGKSIAVVGDDVYVAGYENKTAIVWKNGEPTALTDNTTELSVNDMAISGEDIYVVGCYNAAAVYWKNGQMVELSSFGEIRSIFIVGEDVYMAGNDNGVATYWKNGTPVTLCKDQWSTSEVYGICQVGTELVAAGYYDMEAAVWNINTEVNQTVLTEDWNYAQCRGVAFDEVANTVYTVGNDGYNPVCWVGTQMTQLAVCESFGTATDVCCHDGKCYIGGINDKQAVVWVDGEATVLAEAKTGPSLFGICIAEREVVVAQ